jgi:RNA polymerase sigma factor (sigma-70 family)
MRPLSKTLTIETQGPRSTFEDFFGENYERLLRAMYLVTGNLHEAEELAQGACLRVYERWDEIGETANPMGYAYRVALNLHRSQLRRLAVAARHALRGFQADPIALADERDRLRRALTELPVGQRRALVLLDWVGLSDIEAAEILRIRPQAVRVQASRARHRLKERMKRSEEDE